MQNWPADRVERRSISALTPYAKNARTHTDAQIELIARSMQQWGWTNPVLVDDAGGIIAGHGRVLAAIKLGLTEAPVMVAEGWTEAQKAAYSIADNQLTLAAGWDMDTLASEVKGLANWGFDLSLLGFADLDAMLAAQVAPGLTDPDLVPDAPADPVATGGDLWALGRHRIVCGDCRDPATIARLTNGVPINIAFTSPPYAEQREYDQASGFRPVPPDQYVDWFAPVAANVARHLAPDGSWFVNIKPCAEGLDTSLYVIDLVVAHVRAWGWHFATEFCWERVGMPKSVTRRFKNQFEPVYQFARGDWKMRPDAVRHHSDNVPQAGGKGSGNTSWRNAQGQSGADGITGTFGAVKKSRRASDSDKQGLDWQKDGPLGIKRRKHGTSEWMADAQGGNAAPGQYIGPGLAYPGNRLPTFSESHIATGHAAAFPVGLPEFFCKAYSDPGDVIFDPFLGSGSSLIAAQRSDRAGLGCELSPAYCDVTITRWQNFTGEKATLDGRSFDDVASERRPKAA